MDSEEYRGPAWLRDYGFTDFGDIAADIHAMAEYAKKLAADVETNYAPHSDGVTTAMMTALPEPNAAFAELAAFVATHEAVRDATYANIFSFGAGTSALASEARLISADYHDSDAFAHTTVKAVNNSLGSRSSSDFVQEGA